MISEDVAQKPEKQRVANLTILFLVGAGIVSGWITLGGFQSQVIFLIWFSICCTAGFLLITHWYQGADRNLLLRLFSMSFLVRVGLAVVIYYRTDWLYRDPTVRIAPHWGHVDAAGLMQKATHFVDIWRSSGIVLSIPRVIDTVGGLAHSYAISNALHLLVFGELGEFLPVVTNCFLGALLPALVFRVGQRFIDRKVAKWSAYFVAFDLLLVFYSALNLKEIPAAFLLSATALVYFDLSRRVGMGKVIALFLLATALILVRVYVFVVLVLALMLSLLLEQGPVLSKRRCRRLAFLLVFFLVGISIPQVRLFVSKDIVRQVASSSLADWMHANAALAAERGYFMGQFKPGSLFTLAVNAAHFLTAPSPYRMRFAIADMAKLGAIFWGILLPYFVFGFLYSLKHRASIVWPMIIFVSALIAAYAPFPLTASVRHRVQMMPFAYLITATGVVNYHHKHRKGIRFLIWLGWFAGVTLFEFMFS